MMKKLKKRLILPVLVLLAFLGFNLCTYSVNQGQFAIVKRFEKIEKVQTNPGLYFKQPFVESVTRISTRLQVYDIAPSDVITKDKKSMIADDFIIWKITDPTKFMQTLNGQKNAAEARVSVAAYNATKTIISAMTQDEIIQARGEALTRKITEASNSDIGAYGIEIVSAKIKRLDLPDDNRSAVYERMVSERNNIAASYTAEGNSNAQIIRNETDKEVAILKADAEKKAAELEAEGEATYMQTLQDAYNTAEKADFYNYIRSLDALKTSLAGSGEKTIVLDKDSELVKVLYGR